MDVARSYFMSKRKNHLPECETITLAAACRILGISKSTAAKILRNSPSDFPPTFWIGQRQFLLRHRFEEWLASKGNPQD